MTSDEIDVAIDELETRVERLRALYEQYFLGIEKIEPLIARKDVDRRIWVLRREQIRNTGKRFKLQTIIQRYNTFQQYWQRICREIEAGTYIRHLLRAEARVGETELLTIAARKRLGRRRAAEAEPDSAGASKSRSAVASAEADLAAMAAEGEAPTLPAQPGLVARMLSKPAPEGAAPAPARPVAPAAAPARAPVRAEPRADLGALELDLDLFDAPTQPVAGPPAVQPSPARPAAPARPVAPAAPTAPPRAAPPAAAPRSASSRAAPVARAPAPAPVARPPAARAPTAAPVARPPAAAPAAAAAPPARPGGGSPGIADDRVRALHAKLVEVKRTAKEGGAPSVEALAKTLRETEQRLREKHGRSVDFDVVLKDGKATLKPILR